MKKKILALILAVSSIAVLSGCGKKDTAEITPAMSLSLYLLTSTFDLFFANGVTIATIELTVSSETSDPS